MLELVNKYWPVDGEPENKYLRIGDRFLRLFFGLFLMLLALLLLGLLIYAAYSCTLYYLIMGCL